MKLTLLSIFFLLLSSSINAQEVITTAGDYNSTSTGSLSWTLGEVITETYSNGINSLTQGFNQSQLSATATYELPGLKFKITAYPNPTSDFIFIESDQSQSLKYQLFNLNGELVREAKLQGFQTKVDFKTLVPSTYLIKIYENSIPIKQFKIVKQ
jgi:hypothetical protein